MQIGKDTEEKFPYRLSDNHDLLQYSDKEKDIGLTIDRKLTFDDHIVEKVNKANSIMGIIRRTFDYLDQRSFRLLYISLVRPHLEYANQVWNPYLKKHINLLEKVQRRATKQVQGLSDKSYEQRLKILNLPSLKYRRARGDMIELYKILVNGYDRRVTNFIKLNSDSRTRGHQFRISKTFSRLNIRKNSFVCRSCNVWNSLPYDVVNAPSLYSFERRLDRFWEHQPCKYVFEEDIQATNLDLDLSDDENPELVQEVM